MLFTVYNDEDVINEDANNIVLGTEGGSARNKYSLLPRPIHRWLEQPRRPPCRSC